MPGYSCDNADGQVAAVVITNIYTGDVMAFCVPCSGPWALGYALAVAEGQGMSPVDLAGSIAAQHGHQVVPLPTDKPPTPRARRGSTTARTGGDGERGTQVAPTDTTTTAAPPTPPAGQDAGQDDRPTDPTDTPDGVSGPTE
jgi:hypothetical protein